MADDDKARRDRAALIDTTEPNAARVGDVLDGGRNNYEVDRKIVRAIMSVAPVVSSLVPAARAFHQRAVRFLVAEAGVRQFIDIGASLIMSGNTHEIAQAIDPACRVLYVDDDPVVLAHARALKVSAPEGVARSLDADLRDAGEIIAGARDTIDFGRPVAVTLMATLGFIPDIEMGASMLSGVLDAVVPGSYVVLFHHASDLHPEMAVAARRWNRQSSRKLTLRSADEIAGFVTGLDLVPPGLVPICDWRPAPGDPHFEEVVPFYGLVARKP